MGALAGRRVVVTRAAEQADELVTLLQAAGGRRGWLVAGRLQWRAEQRPGHQFFDSDVFAEARKTQHQSHTG